MGQNIEIRMAQKEDGGRLLEIYKPYIEETVITFEYDTPSVNEFEERISHVLDKFPYLVAIENGTIIGYAYASPYKGRAAYDWSVETSIYIAKDSHGKGVGSYLYSRLFELLKEQGIRNVFACVTLPNEKSEAIHNKFGFSLVGRFREAGYKFNSWHDIGWFEMQLDCTDSVPKKVIPINEIIR